MKKHPCKWLCTFILAAFLYPISDITAQTDYNIPITFSVSSTGINRFITSQWSSMTPSWSNPNYNGISYSIVLEKPKVSLTDGTIKIFLSLDITSSVYNGSVTITPTMTIPSTTISLNNIIAQYTNLRTQIDAITQFTDVRLRNAIEQCLAPIDWIVYPAKALANSTTRWSEGTDLAWKGTPTLNFIVSNNELDFTITPTLTAKAPYYQFKFNRPDNARFGFAIESSCLVEIISIKCWNNLAQEIFKGDVYALAVYNPATGFYTATAEVSRSTGIDWTFALLSFEVRFRRENSEMLYHMDYEFVSGTFTDWRYFDFPHVAAIWGE